MFEYFCTNDFPPQEIPLVGNSLYVRANRIVRRISGFIR